MSQKATLRCWVAAMLILCTTSAFAQPANDNCAGAIAYTPNGGCMTGNTSSGNDSWIGSVGCQSGGNHNDIWYTFTATNNQFNFNITSLGMGNNIELVLVEGTCISGFTTAGSVCGPAPLNDSITGLNIGSTYYFTVSSSGADGSFQICSNLVPAVGEPGQDCPTASIVCDQSQFGTGSVASGNGSINGIGSQEDVLNMACFGSSERQSQWYVFTASTSGPLEFVIDPNVNTDDYDWALFDITTTGCALNTGNAPVLACDWSGCTGNTGASTFYPSVSAPSACSQEGATDCSSAGGPGNCDAFAFEAAPNVTAGNTYALLIDNFSLSNNGFSFYWGGLDQTMTPTIGPDPITGFTASVSLCTATIGGITTVPNYTYSWTWGDGTSTTGTSPGSHTYATPGTYTITQTITDPLGCEATTSMLVTVCPLPMDAIQLSPMTLPDAVLLSWHDQALQKSPSYEVEHSLDGVNFTSIATVPQSSFMHESPTNRAWYRITARDLNGQTRSSNVEEVRWEPGRSQFTILPNPAQQSATMLYGSNAAGEGKLVFFDAQGRKIMQKPIEWGKGLNRISLALEALPAGAYIVRLEGSAEQLSSMLIKMD